MVLLTFSKRDFLLVGLQFAGFSMKRIQGNKNAKSDWIKDKYYACPKTLKQEFLAIHDPTLEDLTIPNPDPSHLLEAFYFKKKISHKD